MINIKIVFHGDVRIQIGQTISSKNESKGVGFEPGLQSNGCVHSAACIPFDLSQKG